MRVRACASPPPCALQVNHHQEDNNKNPRPTLGPFLRTNDVIFTLTCRTQKLFPFLHQVTVTTYGKIFRSHALSHLACALTLSFLNSTMCCINRCSFHWRSWVNRGTLSDGWHWSKVIERPGLQLHKTEYATAVLDKRETFLGDPDEIEAVIKVWLGSFKAYKV